jgi:hypothetical protein
VKFASVAEAVAFYCSVGMRPLPMFGVTGDRCNCGLPEGECRPGKHATPEVESTWKEGAEFGPGDFTERDNIAVALGPWGGSDDWLVCLDLDGPFPVEQYIELPTTLEQKSPRGRHLFFTVPAFAPLGNWVDCFLTKYTEGSALDIRYARGRINVAPSRTLHGGYEWAEFREPAPLPQAAIDVILGRRVERGLPVQWEWHRDGKRP